MASTSFPTPDHGIGEERQEMTNLRIEVPLRLRQGSLVMTPGRVKTQEGNSVRVVQLDEAGEEVTVLTLSCSEIHDISKAFEVLSHG